MKCIDVCVNLEYHSMAFNGTELNDDGACSDEDVDDNYFWATS